jgi:hypothetical protein
MTLFLLYARAGAKLLRVVAHEKRLLVPARLYRGEQYVGELVRALGTIMIRTITPGPYFPPTGGSHKVGRPPKRRGAAKLRQGDLGVRRNPQHLARPSFFHRSISKLAPGHACPDFREKWQMRAANQALSDSYGSLQLVRAVVSLKSEPVEVNFGNGVTKDVTQETWLLGQGKGGKGERASRE